MAVKQPKEEKVSEELKKLREELILISSKIDKIIEMDKRILQSLAKPEKVYREEELGTLDVMTLLSLPDHLRKTAMVMCKVDGATANEVAKETGRARAVESGYLNQLVAMGHVKKRRKGRKVYFYIEK